MFWLTFKHADPLRHMPYNPGGNHGAHHEHQYDQGFFFLGQA
ncbi:uncharacterized protein METZ01_LOCUS385219, partial [marine metagenome]